MPFNEEVEILLGGTTYTRRGGESKLLEFYTLTLPITGEWHMN